MHPDTPETLSGALSMIIGNVLSNESGYSKRLESGGSEGDENELSGCATTNASHAG